MLKVKNVQLLAIMIILHSIGYHFQMGKKMLNCTCFSWKKVIISAQTHFCCISEMFKFLSPLSISSTWHLFKGKNLSVAEDLLQEPTRSENIEKEENHSDETQ